MDKIRVGIFFGGPSREREISFAGGRTVYDNLNKSLFDAIPIFIDSNKKFILLDWKNVYKGTIRDFYPPINYISSSENAFQIYIESLGKLDEITYSNLISEVGEELNVEDIASKIDLAFLALHGYFGEDGQIQAILEANNIPYTGSGILPCAIGMDKSIQKKMMDAGGFNTPKVQVIKRKDWLINNKDYYAEAKNNIRFPLVIRPANQGSSIGVSILEEDDKAVFNAAIDKAFFIQKININSWKKTSNDERQNVIRKITDIREGIGFPIKTNKEVIYHPDELLNFLNESSSEEIVLEAHYGEQTVIIESFIEGREFSCIVLKNENDKPLALPPTEIVKNSALYDYKSKYLPGLSRKITPIDLSDDKINSIRSECEKLYDFLGFHTYARIDGFIQNNGDIYLNDPNTTSGMMPSSFFFHQAAEIGLDPSQFLSYIIRTSIIERIESSLVSNHFEDLLFRMDKNLESLQTSNTKKEKIGVILGGYSFERHISIESGRNIYEKLASSSKYEPIPIFLCGDPEAFELYQIPINLLLKDNADDIKDKILNFKTHDIISTIRNEGSDIMNRYRSSNAILKPIKLSFEELSQKVDSVFIALHGRPGEDGTIQSYLDQYNIPYNGSPVASSMITINKFNTLKLLREHGFITAHQLLLNKNEYILEPNKAIEIIESEFTYPLIAKPVDDGCSSAVIKIKNQEQLKFYLEVLFRNNFNLTDTQRNDVGIDKNEEFPMKEEVLIEEFIQKNGATDFMEVTVGLLTNYKDGELNYEIFEPSEALSGGEVLSLEEKFLAGEGQNITPARFSKSIEEYNIIAKQVKRDLEKAARILNVEGYARIDAFVRIYDDLRAETIIIEVNSLPGMTPATCIFHQCAINGYKPLDFIDSIMNFANSKLIHNN
jgi:D-alanine-D-alanine ligase